ncbi:MAG TPA: MFS transporter [Rhodanobacteraceae bacterium]|nr:MFS transporter [Rhodanobacteraceae bacterium]
MSKLSRTELKHAFALSGVVGLRMFGLFVILPVFSLYAARLPGATPLLIGVAIGIYGFGQALLQVPMGWLSDRIGRRPTITLGLLVFIGGSIVAALAHGMAGLVIGRALQGLGAVSGASQALAADLSSDGNRNKVMAIIGISVGLAFVLAIVLSAPLAAVAGLSGLFWLTALLLALAIVALWAVVPEPLRRRGEALRWTAVWRMVRRPELLVLNGSVLCMHALLTACFVALPLLLSHEAGIPPPHQWLLYLPAIVIAALVMGAVLRKVQGLAQSMALATICALALALSLALFAAGSRWAWLLWLAATLFFSAFNLLEATLPSLTSRLAPEPMRGAAMGAYATCQFFGAGLGGVLGGLALKNLGIDGLFLAAAVAGLLWTGLLAWGRRHAVAVAA